MLIERNKSEIPTSSHRCNNERTLTSRLNETTLFEDLHWSQWRIQPRWSQQHVTLSRLCDYNWRPLWDGGQSHTPRTRSPDVTGISGSCSWVNQQSCRLADLLQQAPMYNFNALFCFLIVINKLSFKKLLTICFPSSLLDTCHIKSTSFFFV